MKTAIRLLLPSLLVASSAALGAGHVWVGPSGGVWSYSGNWVGGVPATGEGGGTVLLFASGSNSEDNIAGLVVDQISLAGSSITITRGPGVSLGLSSAVATTQISAGGTGNTIA